MLIVTARRMALVLAMAWALGAVPSAAETADLHVPAGPAVLTIVGSIDSSNRGPYNATEDKFFGYHEYSFDKAVQFDIAMLESLGMHSAAIDYEGWPAPSRFEGPLLVDLLAAVGAQGATVMAVALDGYAERIEWAELDEFRWILATRRDGQFMPIGSHGPLWLVYDHGPDHRYTPADEARWPWAVFLIVVE